MTPRFFYEEIARKNCSDLRGAASDMRFCVNAVMSLDACVGILHAHLVSTSAVPGIVTDDIFKDRIANQHFEYRMVRDLAFSLKHGELTGRRPRLVRDPAQAKISVVTLGAFILGRDRLGGHVVFIEDLGGAKHRADTLVMKVSAIIDDLLTLYSF